MGIKTALSYLNPFNYRFSSEARSSYPVYDLKGRFWEINGGNSNSKISERQALRIAAVYTCVAIRRDAVGMLPFNVFRESNGKKEVAYNHPAYYAIHTRPNAWQTATQFWGLMVQNIDVKGNAYALIVRSKRYQFLPLDPDKMDVREEGGEPYYFYEGRFLPARDVLHFKDYSLDGKVGLSKIAEFRETIGSAKTQREFANRSLSAVPPVYIKTPHGTTVNTDGAKSFKDKLKTQAENYFADGEIPILTNGMEIGTVGLKPMDAAYLEQINATKEDIYGIFRVPPAIAGAFKTGVTYNNLEQQNLQLLIYTLNPILKNIQEEVDYKVFLSGEPCFSRFNVGALLRTDLKSQSEWFSSMFKIGYYSINEMRDINDENPIEDESGNYHWVEGNNMVPTHMVGEIMNQKTKAPTQMPAEVKKRLKEIFNGHTDQLTNYLEQ